MSPKPIPSPQAKPILGSAREFIENPPHFLNGLIDDHGEIAQFNAFNQRFYVLGSPELVREVLVTKADHFPKDRRDVKILSRFLGNGLVTNSGEFHKQQRKLAQPAFHARRIQAYADVMVDYAAAMRAGWSDGETIDMSAAMMELTMFIVSKTLFDAGQDDMVDIAEKVGRAVHEMQLATNHDFQAPLLLPEWLPTKTNRRRKAARKVLDETVAALIAERQATAVNGRVPDTGDLLSMLLLAQDESGQGMDERQVKDELITLFVAGHETTSNALSWTWYLLGQHPEVEARLHQELDIVLNGRLPTLADLRELQYTEMVLKEAMRIYPPVWTLNARQAAVETTIGDYRIPQGAVIFISPYVLHRRPAYFPDPERFDPLRFAPENEPAIPRYGYIPFGAGPRVCIGNSFAMMEARLLLATLAQKFRFMPVSSRPADLHPLVTLSVKDGLPMRLAARPTSVPAAEWPARSQPVLDLA